MPLNEAAGYRRSYLSREEQRKQEAAIYGVSTDDMTPNLSHEEIERMRKIIAAHDQQNVVKEFDLNNPPKVPYRYQEFPRCMYRSRDGKTETKIAHNAGQMAEAIENGWSKDPLPLAVETPKLDAATAAEVAKVDQDLGLAPKKKPGRKPKTQPEVPTE